MRQRVKLAQCLLHEPELVILDEPMNGLDPMAREDFGNVMRELARDGKSILISSHLLHDLEALCGDFLILRWGRIPRSLNEAVSPDTRTQWPNATTFRCDAPEKLARYLFERHLLRGFDIDAESGALHARWSEAGRFYDNFQQILLESEVRIFEVQSTASFLEKTIELASVP